MVSCLGKLPAGSVVLLQACCHNPTGADLTDSQWRELLPVFERGGLCLPFIDMAYQGSGAAALKRMRSESGCSPPSCPKFWSRCRAQRTFGLYRERTGSLHVVSDSHTAAADAALSQLARIARTIYSMPPDHGAAIVQAVLGNDAIPADRRGLMSSPQCAAHHGLRSRFVKQLAVTCPERDFGCMTRQLGMFSLLGVNKAQVRELRLSHHIYMTDDSRINIAGLRTGNLAYVARLNRPGPREEHLASRSGPNRSCRGRRRRLPGRARILSLSAGGRSVTSAAMASTRRRGA
jgi:aspartate/tyrosine/aromatic aminotransferase